MKRIISLSVALMLVASSMYVTSYAEEGISTPTDLEEVIVQEQVEEPTVEEVTVEEAVVEDSSVGEPVDEEPAAEDLAIEEPSDEEPVVEETVVDEAAIGEPTDDEPTVDDTAVEEIADEEPADEEAVIDPTLTLEANPAFIEGYVVVVEESVILNAAHEAFATAERGQVLYVSAVDQRYATVRFEVNGVAAFGLMEKTALRPATQTAIDEMEGTVTWNGYLLTAVTVLAEETGEAADVEETEEVVIEEETEEVAAEEVPAGEETEEAGLEEETEEVVVEEVVEDTAPAINENFHHGNNETSGMAL